MTVSCLGFTFTGKQIKAPPTLLNWQVVHERMPWNIILLLGGGFALAAGSEVGTHKQHPLSS